MDLQAPAQAHPCAMQHYPEVVLGRTQNLTNFFRRDLINFSQNERLGDFVWQS
jgi:hypothetical protein